MISPAPTAPRPPPSRGEQIRDAYFKRLQEAASGVQAPASA